MYKSSGPKTDKSNFSPISILVSHKHIRISEHKSALWPCKLTEFMFARVVRDLEDVEGDAVDAGLAQSVEARDIRASKLSVIILEEKI